MNGKKLASRYQLLERVGGGGMAVVYKAKDILLDRIVAVKILRPQYALDDDFVHRFRREAQAAARLSHPNVVSIYDVGVEEDIHYIVMEFVEGPTLKEYITQSAPLPLREAVDIARQIAEALEHAHQHHIIHRDIKPHNILLGKNLRVKVTDFGIARAVTSSTITHTGSVLGSVHYFSPEQARGGITGEKSDIYSLGIVLYEMLTGTLPFSGDSPISVALKHLQDSFTEPRKLNPLIPQSVENIILRCLAKDPLLRYASATELIADLYTCLNPERANEQKIDLEEDLDEEATKIMPAITEKDYQTRIADKETRDEDEEEWNNEDWEEDKPKRSLWTALGFSFLVLFLLAFGLYQGFKYITNLFYVPEVVIHDVTNLPLEEAIKILEEQNLKVNHTQTRYSDEVEEGHVISQNPAAGTSVKENTYVSLTVSLGKEKEPMPRLVSLPVETALRYIQDYQHQIIEETTDEQAPGYVLRQVPEPGEMVVPEDTLVILYVSKGVEKVSLPNLVGKSVVEAEAELTRHKLQLNASINEDFSDLPEGLIFKQAPEPGEQVDVGSSITVWVSKGYKETTRDKIIEVPIELEEYEVAQIRIYIKDETGEKWVVNEMIDQSKTYQLAVKVSREQKGIVQVFKNDELYFRQDVTFD